MRTKSGVISTEMEKIKMKGEVIKNVLSKKEDDKRMPKLQIAKMYI